jgi:hypothetical protein
LSEGRQNETGGMPGPESHKEEFATGAAPVNETDSFSLRIKSPAVLPMVFREVSPEAVELTPSQAKAVEEIQDQFAGAVGGETADAGHPGYRKKWDQEQRLSDLRLRAMIGAQAFAAWQREAHWRAMEAARSADTAK